MLIVGVGVSETKLASGLCFNASNVSLVIHAGQMVESEIARSTRHLYHGAWHGVSSLVASPTSMSIGAPLLYKGS